METIKNSFTSKSNQTSLPWGGAGGGFRILV